MRFERAQIVRSRQGRDRGCLFCVLDATEDVLLLAVTPENRDMLFSQALEALKAALIKAQ